jgi:hypothetical protein
MIHPEGWVSLAQITSELDALFRREAYAIILNDKSKDRRYLFDTANYHATTSVWGILNDSDSVSVVFPDSRTALVAKYLFETGRIESRRNYHICIRTGTVGSGNISLGDPDEIDEGDPVRLDLERAYGPFLFLPIIIRRTEYQSFLSKISPPQGTDSELKNAMSPAEIASEIVRAFASGVEVTRTWAKNQFMPDEKSVAFSAVWKLATEQEKGLSKPGPRSKRDPAS